MQRHYKLSKIEKKGMNGIIFFFLRNSLFIAPAHLFAIRGRLQRWEGGIRNTSKISISQLFGELRKFQKNCSGLFSKNPTFHFIMNWEKLRSSARLTFKTAKSFCELETAWKYSLRLTLKNLSFAPMDELGKIISSFKFHC